MFEYKADPDGIWAARIRHVVLFDLVKIDSGVPKLLFMGKIFIELLVNLQHDEFRDEWTQISENMYI